MKKKVSMTLSCILAVGAVAAATTGCATKPAQTINVIGYGEYVEESVMKQFEDEYGIEVKYDEAESPEEIYAKFTSGTVDYDLICVTDYMILKLQNEGLLGKVDYSSMENTKNIGDPYWRFTANFDTNNEYALPYFWGTVGILYNTDKVKEEVDSWDVLFDGSHAGSITMPNSMRDAFFTSLFELGYSINTTDRNQLLEAQQKLIAQYDDVYSYDLDSARLQVVNGDVDMAVVYSGEAYKACNEGAEKGSNLNYVTPKEGTNIWIDCFAMSAKPQNEDGAKKFLDFLCREDVAMLNFEYSYYSTPNTAVYDALPEEVKSNPYLFPQIDNLEQIGQVCTMVDDDITAYMSELWTELKADL